MKIKKKRGWNSPWIPLRKMVWTQVGLGSNNSKAEKIAMDCQKAVETSNSQKLKRQDTGCEGRVFQTNTTHARVHYILVQPNGPDPYNKHSCQTSVAMHQLGWSHWRSRSDPQISWRTSKKFGLINVEMVVEVWAMRTLGKLSLYLEGSLFFFSSHIWW